MDQFLSNNNALYKWTHKEQASNERVRFAILIIICVLELFFVLFVKVFLSDNH